MKNLSVTDYNVLSGVINCALSVAEDITGYPDKCDDADVSRMIVNWRRDFLTLRQACRELEAGRDV